MEGVAEEVEGMVEVRAEGTGAAMEEYVPDAELCKRIANVYSGMGTSSSLLSARLRQLYS